MTHYAIDERMALCDSFGNIGPDAPTLCEGWTTRDLAAHLIIRERRPDAAAGIMISPLASHTARVQAATAKKPWELLVAMIRSGPPRWALTRIAALNEATNATEFFVHHEDARRAQPNWAPRELPVDHEEFIWRSLQSRARLMFRRVPVGVVLVRPDGENIAAHAGEPAVTLTGMPSEILLYAFGRTSHARVELAGDPAAIGDLTNTKLTV